MIRPDILLLSPDDVRRVFDIDAALSSQERAFRSTGVRAPRTLVPGPADSTAFCYTDRLAPDSAAVTKFGSVNPGNVERGLPSISAVITVLDPLTGQLRAVMDGVSVTTLRTSAASAVACRALALPGADTLAVIGSGVQAEAHVRALTHALERIKQVTVWGPDADGLAAMVDRLGDLTGVEVDVAASAEEAVSGNQIVVLCTTSHTPVVEDSWIGPGSTVISIGSFAPDRCEVPVDLLTRARVVVDDVSIAETDAGPVIEALRLGALDRACIASLREVLLGDAPGRSSAEEIVFYNSVGIGAQDASAAETILARAREQRVGTEIRW